MLSDFHFLRPELLWFVIPVFVIWLFKRNQHVNNQWRTVIASHLAPSLLASSGQKSRQWLPLLLGLFWLIAIIALAGPTWQKIEKPVFKSNVANMIVMDMSLSMRSTDVKPDRLTKARFKTIDLATALGDGEVGLVAYAGDAYPISPLTKDPRNVATLVKSLSPEIMPITGSYPLLGLQLSEELMSQAGYLSGQIYWITDGVDQEDMDDLREFAANTPFQINVLAVGTRLGAPIKQLDGTLLKDARGSIVIPKLNGPALQELARLSGGVFQNITADNTDIKRLASVSRSSFDETQATSESDDQTQLTGDDWHEAGPIFVLIAMAFLLMAFRRGISFVIVLPVIGALSVSAIAPPAYANTDTEAQQNTTHTESWTDRWFKSKNQRGIEAFQQQNYNKAQQTFDDPSWKAAAAYKSGDYPKAAELYRQDSSAEGDYNLGNALTQMGQYEKAIEAYDRALQKKPNLEQAQQNKAIAEQLLKQAQESSDEQDEQNKQQDASSEQDNQDNQSNSSSSEDGNNEQQNQDGQGQSQQDQAGNEQQNQNGQNGSEQQSEMTADPSQSSTQSQSDEPGQADSQSTQPNTSQQQSEQAGEATEASEQGDVPEGTEQQKGSMSRPTPEQIAEQEEMQKLEQLLRKVDDDPSILLKNKMLLESKRRQFQNRFPKGVKKSW